MTSVQKYFLVSFLPQVSKKLKEPTSADLSCNIDSVDILFTRFPNKERMIRNTLIEINPFSLADFAKQGKKDLLFSRPVFGIIENPPVVLGKCGSFLKLSPRVIDMAWIVGILGACKTNIHDALFFNPFKYRPARRNVDFCYWGSRIFFKNNDTFMTESFFNERRSVFPDVESRARYEHFFRSYPLKPNGKRRKHWVWGEGFRRS